MQLAPFKLERYFAQYEFAAKYLLCSSDCESLTIDELLALEPDARQRLHQCWLGYTETQGSPTLRAAISALYSTIAAEHVLVHSGAEEAIFLAMHALLQPGDHVIVQAPCYQSLAEVARSIGCDVTFWRGDPAHNWQLDLHVLEQSLRPSTKLIVVNMPHNPTGYLMPEQDFWALCQLADVYNIVLFSDEVYRESEYTPHDRLPAACDLSERAVSLGVMSKTYGLPGLRIGWIATHNATLYERMAQLKDYTTICNSAPSEVLAAVALRQRETIVARNQAIIQHNLGELDAFFGRHADIFGWQRPHAGPIAFPQLLHGDIEQFCHELVTTKGVLLLPGTLYDDPDNRFRIGFGRRNMPEALAQLEAFMQG